MDENPLVKYQKNETPEQKKARTEKAALTARKNNAEKRMMEKIARNMFINEDWTYTDPKNPTKTKMADGVRMILDKVSALLDDPKQCIAAAVFLRDTMGEKPTDKVDNTVRVRVEDVLKGTVVENPEDEY